MSVRMKVAPLIAAVVAFAAVLGAQAGDGPYERSIRTAGAGPQRLAVDATLLASASPFRVVRRGQSFVAEGGLDDLRLTTSGGLAVPYLLIPPPTGERRWVGGRVLAMGVTKKSSGFEVDLGAPQDVDAIRIAGLPVPHLKRAALEGSGDRARWTVLVGEGTLFELPEEGLRQDALEFEGGAYRYFRLTWNDANSGRLPPPSSVEARLASAVPDPPAETIGITVDRRASEPGVSRFRLRLPAANLPIVAIDLAVGGGHVHRKATIGEARFGGLEVAPVTLGSAMLSRVTRDGATASALRIPIDVPRESELDLTIDDGANPPLEVLSASAELARLPWIYFEAPAAGPVVARYGNRSLPKPSYDLEAVRDSVKLAALPEATWAKAENDAAVLSPSTVAPPVPGAVIDASGFSHVRSIDPSAAGLVSLPLDAHVLALSRGPGARFADVRILDAANRQIPYLLELRSEPLSLELKLTASTDSQAAELKSAPGSRQRSVYAAALPHPNLPPARLILETSARVFQRTVRVGIDRVPDDRRREAWFDVRATEAWRHADEATPARPLSIGIATSEETALRVVVDEGDNAPLPITSARLLLPSYRLRFYYPPDAALKLVYGRRDLLAPQYDLALLAGRVMGAPAREATVPAPAGGPPPRDAFIAPRTFWVLLGAAVLVLLGLIVRLLRAPGTTSS